MPELDPELWQEVSPYLDQVIGMSEDELAAWRASVFKDNPALAVRLDPFLTEYLEIQRDQFLERQTVSFPQNSRPSGCAIGVYTLISQIGQGGMGAVWLAERNDGRFERRVAIKFLSAARLSNGGERFKREGKILGRLDHPHIAELVDAGVSSSGQPYLVLEYVDGEHIDRYFDKRDLDIEPRIRIFLDVLSAVSHAHSHLIVHRDLKPSNVLVRGDGQVKLLDFGIAKLLEEEGSDGTATLLTRENGPLTPAYAAPEQVTNEPVTTATDVYALGVLLYQILTGQHPAGPGPHSPADLVRSIVDTDAPRVSEIAAAKPGKMPRRLRGDLDMIVAKAVRKAPRDRYQTVEHLAEDLAACLESRPINARKGDLFYRARKLMRRFWLPLAMAALALAGLLIGMYAANRERIIAQRRFEEVRQLSNKLFDIDRQVLALPGSSKARQLIVDTSLDYLQRLARDVQGDPDLALDVGTAYMRVGRVQGVPISPNLGQPDNAERNLQMAERLVSSVLQSRPANRTAFLRLAQISHDRMVLAQIRRPDNEALPLGRRSEEWLEKYLASGPVEEAEKVQVALVGQNVANWYVRKGLTDEGLRLLRRSIGIAKATNQPDKVGAAQIVVARALRGKGDLEGALSAIREGVAMLEPSPGEKMPGLLLAFGVALGTQGEILGEDNAVNLGRPAEAVECFERSFQIAAGLARQDASDAFSRLSLSGKGIRLAAILRHSDPRRAIAIYDEVLARLAELRNNSRARRDEVRALVWSAYPLREVGHSGDARKRLDIAFSRLRELKLYPAEQVELGSEPDDALRALAEYEAGSGKLDRGIETYQELLRKIVASQPNLQSDLADATSLSYIYMALANLQYRAGRIKDRLTVEGQRLELWRYWAVRLPNNSFVLRHLGGHATSRLAMSRK